MKINYIKYHNYRCFEDVYVRFDTTDQKNISLVLGVNGTGKTEMLFSFQWVLYGFDFKSMREKEETPYSLNSALYHRLEVDRHANSVDCWVELSFTDKSIEYFVKRTETFRRVNDKLSSFVKVELSHTEPNGERTIPETNKEIVEEQLSRIIPKSILEGITFDGERMKKLNIIGDQSKETIKNVISLVTNEKLFDLCTEEIKDVKGDIRKEKMRINKSAGNVTAEELEKEIVELEENLEDKDIELQGILNNQDKVDANLELISYQLSQLEDAAKLEQKRKGLEKDMATAKKQFEQNTDQFYKRLVDGYALVADKMVEDVKTSIENVDVPTGLTVEAVKSILRRSKCICGCDMNEEVEKNLTELIASLPPDNISSTLLYMAKQFDGEKKRAKRLLKDSYQAMKSSEEEIAKIKIQLSEISSSLVDNVSDQIKTLETERRKQDGLKGRLKGDEERCRATIDRDNKRLKDAKKEMVEASGTQDQIRSLDAEQIVLELFMNAIVKIGEKNSEISLESINNYLTEAYNLLSEDTGRRIYICQYHKKDKYRLVTYVKSKYEELRISWINSGRIKALEDVGFSDSEIHEKIILEVVEGKSTGQSKVNSLSFAKAILDYSNEAGTTDQLRVSHDYPFLIDSPFTELSGRNLDNVAQNIHTFANQIILMADDKSYGGVQQFVAPSVKSTTRLLKNSTDGITYTD
jgi:DNA sulfur modification protein DndD